MPAPTIDGSGVVTGAVNDTASYSSSAGAKTTAGSNRIGIVVAAGYMFGTSGTARGSFTWDGVAMTRLREYDGSADDDHWVGLYYILNPPTAGSTVTGTFAGNLTGGVVVASYQDVNQTTPFGTEAVARGVSGTASVDVSSASGELVIDALFFKNDPTVGSGQTNVGEANQADKYAGHSYEAGAGTVTMSWTATSADWVAIGVALKPVANPSVALTGTGGDGLLESEVVAGGETIIAAVTDGEWVS